MRAWRQLWCGSLLVALVLTVSGCENDEPVAVVPDQEPDYGNPLPPGEKALFKLTDPSMYPDFSEGYLRRANLELAAGYSLEYLSKPSSRRHYPYLDITHERAVASIEAFLDVLATANSGPELDRMIKERFDIYMSRGYDNNGIVWFTGYYRPIFDARLERDATFRYPLYRRPDDLELEPVTGQYRRKGGGPYYTRSEIDTGALAGRGLELCWLKDRFEAYIVTIQGSGRLRLADGSLYDIAYHGNNGHEYTSVGQRLVDKGLISANELSLQGLIEFFRNHPEELDAALAVNDRYVFFYHPSQPGPAIGSLNVPVTEFRSIATDKEVYPPACTAYLVTEIPAHMADGSIKPHSYSGFAFDQDTGGAIRAAGRCDFFLGTGPRMGELAGRTFSEGELYYIFVKEGGWHSDVVASPGSTQLPPAEPGY